MFVDSSSGLDHQLSSPELEILLYIGNNNKTKEVRC